MITKRQLGLIFITLGGLALLGLFAVDWLGASEFQGIGPTQKIALIAAGVLVLVGVTLLPLGEQPA